MSSTSTTPQQKLRLPDAVRSHRACADWIKYHNAHRDVFVAILNELYRAKQAGKTKASVKAIINYLRWNMWIQCSGDDYKINDKYTGIYTHVIVYNFPELAHMIDTRELRAVNPNTV